MILKIQFCPFKLNVSFFFGSYFFVGVNGFVDISILAATKNNPNVVVSTISTKPNNEISLPAMFLEPSPISI